MEKLNRKKYEVKNTETNEKILEVELFKVYNSHTDRKHKLPKILFININETMEFEIDIQNELELVKFLFEWEIVFLNGQPNEKKHLTICNIWKIRESKMELKKAKANNI